MLDKSQINEPSKISNSINLNSLGLDILKSFMNFNDIILSLVE